MCVWGVGTCVCNKCMCACACVCACYQQGDLQMGRHGSVQGWTISLERRHLLHQIPGFGQSDPDYFAGQKQEACTIRVLRLQCSPLHSVPQRGVWFGLIFLGVGCFLFCLFCFVLVCFGVLFCFVLSLQPHLEHDPAQFSQQDAEQKFP